MRVTLLQSAQSILTTVRFQTHTFAASLKCAALESPRRHQLTLPPWHLVQSHPQFSAPLQAQAIRNFDQQGIDVRLGVRVTAVGCGAFAGVQQLDLVTHTPPIVLQLSSGGRSLSTFHCPCNRGLQVERDTIALTNARGEKEQLPYGVCVWSTGRRLQS